MKKLIKIMNVVSVNYVLFCVITLTINPSNIPYMWFFKHFNFTSYLSGNPFIAMATFFSIIGIITFNYHNVKMLVNKN